MKEERLNLVMKRMLNENLPANFVAQISSLATNDKGIEGLLLLWTESDQDDRNEIIAMLQDRLEDKEQFARQTDLPVNRPKVPYEDFDEVIISVKGFKEKLKKLIKQKGGVTKLSKLTDIPQPSLSRMLNDTSMPRRKTLEKIALALDLPEKNIVTEWYR